MAVLELQDTLYINRVEAAKLAELNSLARVRVKAMIDEDDKNLFRDFVSDLEPLVPSSHNLQIPVDRDSTALVTRRRAAVYAEDRDKSNNFLAGEEHITRVKPLDILSFKRDGVQQGVFRRLKQGYYFADASLDLHRKTVVQSRHEVFDFIRGCVTHDIRCGLISHGKGEYRESPALLKSCVNHWLAQLDDVLAFHTAPRDSGGLGAVVILLRKSEKKIENRDKFVDEMR